MNQFWGFRTLKCYLCGKEFVWQPEWVYKAKVNTNTKCFCSWGCMRRYEKMKEEEKRIEREKKRESKRLSAYGQKPRETCERSNERDGDNPKDDA